MFSTIIENLGDEPWGHSYRACLRAISTLVGVSDNQMGGAETLSGELSMAATDALFLGHRKCCDIILID
jgi:HEPN domain-containing protein